MSDIRLTPKQIAAKAKRAELKKSQDDGLRADYAFTFGSASGKNVLRDICKMSGMHRSDVVVSANGEIHLISSEYNMAFRNFYLKIRDKVRPGIIRDIETELGPLEDSLEDDIFS